MRAISALLQWCPYMVTPAPARQIESKRRLLERPAIGPTTVQSTLIDALHRSRSTMPLGSPCPAVAPSTVEPMPDPIDRESDQLSLRPQLDAGVSPTEATYSKRAPAAAPSRAGRGQTTHHAWPHVQITKVTVIVLHRSVLLRSWLCRSCSGPLSTLPLY